MKYLEKMKTKTAFEIIFIATVGLSILLWLIFMFIGGDSSSQLRIFSENMWDFLADSTNVLGYSAGLDPYNNQIFGLGEKAYPPLTYALMFLVSRVVNVNSYLEKFGDYKKLWTDPKVLILIIIFTVIVIIMMYTIIQVTKNGSMLIKSLVAFVLCFSFPMLFSIERGNTIIITSIMCMIYLFYYNSENKILKELALISLAVAVAFKITPAFLGILLLYNKQFKDAIRTVIYGIIIVFGPFIFLHGGFLNIPLMFNNIFLNLKYYSSPEGCTLAGSLNKFGRVFTSNDYIVPDIWVDILKITTVIISIILLSVIPFFKTQWEKVATVVIILIILPSHSGTYCVLYMIPVIVMFLNEEKHRNVDIIYLLCMIMISWVYFCKVSDYIFNIHFALPVMTLTLLITGIANAINYLKHKNLIGKGV